MTVDTLDLALLVGALVLLVAVVAVRLTSRAGLPSLLLYLAIGMALGESGAGVQFEDAETAHALGFAALVVILAEGGLTTRWSVVRPVMPFAAVLATLGVALSVGVTACIAYLVLDVEWRTALLLGAVVSSTDAAAVFATLRRLSLRPRLVATLEAESGLNDAPVVILVTLFASEAWNSTNPAEVVGLMLYELLAGAAVGLLVGRLGREVVSRLALPVAGLYPLAVLGLAVLAYAGASTIHASGFLAVYLAALMLGNSRLPHHRATLGFAEGLAWLAQIGLFVMLGLLASPTRLGETAFEAVAIGIGLLLLARPLSVVASALPFRLPWREQAFLSWAGLRGAVPIVWATIPLSEHMGGATAVFDTTFLLVVVFTAIQGPTIPWVARRLGLAAPTEAHDLPVESAPLEDLGADLLQLAVPPGSRLQGIYLAELRLPPGAAVTLVVRGGTSFVPGPDTRIDTGDQLLVVATAASRDAAEERLRAVSRRGKLARWFGDTGRELHDAGDDGSSQSPPRPRRRRPFP
ncbi:MAG: potassium/proton antiporter [Actinomycetes bacterium]